VSYVRRRVWVSLPYAPAVDGPPPDYPSVNLIFDATIGPNGAYTMFQTAPSFETDVGNGVSGYGLIAGCDWRDVDDKPYYLMTSQDDEWPYVYYVDDYNNTIDEVPGAPTFDGRYPSSYRTSWFADQTYAQLKTFIRPYFVFKEVQQDTALYLQRFKNYDEGNEVGATRTVPLFATQSGSVYSTDTNPGDGYAADPPPNPLDPGTAIYGTIAAGAQIKRKGIAPLGRGYAIQLQFNGPNSTTVDANFPGRKWGLNSIAYKFKRRKIRST
jgi:hypothetical protein